MKYFYYKLKFKWKRKKLLKIKKKNYKQIKKLFCALSWFIVTFFLCVFFKYVVFLNNPQINKIIGFCYFLNYKIPGVIITTSFFVYTLLLSSSGIVLTEILDKKLINDMVNCKYTNWESIIIYKYNQYCSADFLIFNGLGGNFTFHIKSLITQQSYKFIFNKIFTLISTLYLFLLISPVTRIITIVFVYSLLSNILFNFLKKKKNLLDHGGEIKYYYQSFNNFLFLKWFILPTDFYFIHYRFFYSRLKYKKKPAPLPRKPRKPKT